MGMSPTEKQSAEYGSEIWVYEHKLISQIMIGFKVAILFLVLLKKKN